MIYGVPGGKNGNRYIGRIEIGNRERLAQIDLREKKRDFSHLVFNDANTERILQFPDIVTKHFVNNNLLIKSHMLCPYIQTFDIRR